MRGTVLGDDFCPADVAQESGRYRSDAEGQREQTLCDGIVSQHSSLDIGRTLLT